MKFKKYYKYPLRLDDYCGTIIWCDNDTWAFNVLIDDVDKANRITDCINGTVVEWKNGKFNRSDDDICQIDFVTNDGKVIPILLCRGWGSLTGTGGFNLAESDAAKIQDEFINYCIETLNKK